LHAPAPAPPPCLPPHPLPPLQAFKQLDKDGSGTISLDELAEALRRFGIYDDAKELLASADENDVRPSVARGLWAVEAGPELCSL
jgi:hypothetical protein